MSWYRAGTINLTNGSVDVIGVGTAFSSEVRFSDILLVGGALYEIVRVESDTKLKLSTPFQGATASGSAYAIIRNLTNASNFELMKKIEAFLTDRQRSMDEFVEWINGLPGTGPTSNGVFPLTDRYGVTVYCKSPKQMEADTLALTNRQAELIEETETTLSSAESRLAALGDQQAWADQILGYKNAAAASATLAQQWADNNENVAVTAGKFSAKHHAIKAAASATASANSATAASTSATNASGSATAASTSAANAASSATAAGTSATNAANSATAAASSATAAQTSASQAATSKTGADTAKAGADASKTAAGVSEANAAASATAAATSASAASSSANTAKDWAEKTAGAVTGTQYSAKYHAQLAQTARADVETRQNDVMARQTDVTAKYNSVVTLEASALASKNAAATSATTAATKATEASNSATAASTSATNAAASATTATTKAGEASTSASNAAASATAAANSATAAATYKTGADTAKAAAESAKTAAETAQTGAVAAKTAAEAARDRAELAASSLTGNLVEYGGIDLSGNAYPAAPTTAGFWKVTAAGVVGGVEYGIGDTLVYSKNLGQFYKIDNTESVTSVNGKTGALTLNAADVGALATGGTAAAATKLATARTLSVAGDGTGSASFDGTANAAITLTLANSGVVAGTYPKVTVDAKGRVTAGAALVAADIPTLNQNTTGNAATATKLATARNINGVPFDGTTDVTIADSTKLPLTGGNVSGAINVTTATKSFAIVTAGVERGFIEADTYGIRMRSRAADATIAGTITLGTDGVTTVSGNLTVGGTASGNGSGLTSLNAANLATGIVPDARLSGTYTGVNITGNAATATKLATARTLSFTGDAVGSGTFDGSGNISIALIYKDSGVTPGTYTKVTVDQKGNITGGTTLSAADIPTLNQNTTGNAATATKLATARTINGATFDGTANVVTASWGTARSLTIGATAKNVDGSAAVTWTLAEIGANNAANLTTGILPDARLSGVYSGFSHKLDGTNTVFTSPNTGSPSPLARTVYGLAEYRSAASAQVGALVFIAPNTLSTIMHQFEIQGLLYNQNIVRLAVQGYRTTGAWSDLRKVSFGTADVMVRWGVTPDGRNCLILGDVGTTWSYPHISIVRAMFSHTNAADSYCTGWEVATVTDLSTYTNVSAAIADSAVTGSITGNAATATALQTARTINGVSFNGTANITVADATKLPLTGGTLTGTLNGTRGSFTGTGNDYHLGGLEVRGNGTSNTVFPTIGFHQPNLWASSIQLRAASDFRFYAQGGTAYADVTAATFNGSASGLTDIPATQLTGIVPDASLSGTYTGVSITGNAATATKLATARTINGVSFDGTANITVADSTKLPLAGGTLTGVLTLPVGTAAAPSLTFSGDTNTGIYRVGADAVGIATAGTVAVDFDAVGNTNVYGRLRSTGNLSSAAWTTTGCSFDLAAATFTDTSSAAAAVVTTRAAATVNTPTFASANAITVTNAATLYIAGRPTAGTNTTITSGWALWVNSGDSRFGGAVTATGNISQTSDIRVKEGIERIPDAMNKVVRLRGVTYKRKDTGERQTGVIAQEVQAVLPEAVIQGEEHLAVAYGNMVGLLIEAIKELNAKVDSLQNEVAELRRVA